MGLTGLGEAVVLEFEVHETEIGIEDGGGRVDLQRRCVHLSRPMVLPICLHLTLEQHIAFLLQPSEQLRIHYFRLLARHSHSHIIVAAGPAVSSCIIR